MAANGCDTETSMAGSVLVGTFDEICVINLTSCRRSIVVRGFQASATPEDLIVHFQRKKNGGGDIESIAVSKRGIAVITFARPEGEIGYYVSGERTQMYEVNLAFIQTNDRLIDLNI